MFDWFKKILITDEKKISSDKTENFADTLLVELKASSNYAITPLIR